MTMVLRTAGRGGILLLSGRRTALLSARPVNAVSVLPRHFSSNKPPVSRERPEFRQAELPKDNIQFKATSFMETADRMANILFLGEIFRALWLSGEVGCAETD